MSLEAWATSPAAMGIEPVHGPPAWQPAGRYWRITRYADVTALLRRAGLEVLDIHAGIARLERGSGHDYGAITGLLAGILFFRNPPYQETARRFLVRSLSLLRPAFSEAALGAIAADIAAQALARGEAEACHDICDRMPLEAMSRALGLADDTGEAIVRSGLKVVQACQRALSLRALDAIQIQARTIEALIERDLADPAPGLKAMAELGRGEFGFGERELVGLVFMFVMAGIETTSSLMASALYFLSVDPRQCGLAAADPDRLGRVLEETLRLAPPVRILNRRIAPQGLEIGGQAFAAGDHLSVDIELANRDPSAFADPDRFAPERSGPPALSFGGGAHVCIGSHLGKLEARLMLQALLGAAEVTLADPEPAWLVHPEERRLARLDVRLSPVSQKRVPHP